MAQQVEAGLGGGGGVDEEGDGLKREGDGRRDGELVGM